MELTRLLTTLAIASLLSACTAVNTQPSKSSPATYQQAMEAFDNQDYASAVQMLEQVNLTATTDTKRHNAQLSLLIAQHRLQRYSAAIQAGDRFISNHPQSPSMDQALYLRGNSLLKTYLATANNSIAAQGAVRDFNQLLSRFSDSPHAVEARIQLGQLRQQMARYELGVAQASLNSKAYTAAANRARYVLESYKETDAIPAALEVLAQAYDGLGLEGQAASTRAILTANFERPIPSNIKPEVSAAPQPVVSNEAAKPKPVTKKLATAAAPLPAKRPLNNDGWVVQLASFKQVANADRLDQRLRQAGYDSFVSTRGDYHRVIVGNETEPAKIQKLLSTLQQRFQLKGIVKPASSILSAKH